MSMTRLVLGSHRLKGLVLQEIGHDLLEAKLWSTTTSTSDLPCDVACRGFKVGSAENVRAR
jgi:hypothetical protein